MNQTTGKQHIVNKAYLRHFANVSNKLQVFAADAKEIVRPRGYGGVCWEQFYYAAETGKKDTISQLFEQMFREVEDRVGRSYDKRRKIWLSLVNLLQQRVDLRDNMVLPN
jgi:hypothetical protein